MTIKTELDKVQSILHDDGAIWSRSELLRWCNDGYQELVARAQAVRRWTLMDTPGRVAYGITYNWEDRHANGAMVWQALLPTVGANYNITTFWEAEQLIQVTPTTTLDGFTQLWERSQSNATNRHFRFTLPKDHDRIKQVLFDDQPLGAVDTRTLDHLHNGWMRDGGDILFYTLGVGRARSIELFEVETQYVQSYELIGDGIPRSLSGTRTYTERIEEPAWLSNEWAYMTTGEHEALGWHDNLHAGAGLPNLGRQATRAATSTYHPLFLWEEEQLSGSSTFTNATTVNLYSWESVFDGTAWEFPIGLLRGVVSDDRQYWPVEQEMEGQNFLGKALQWQSSVNALAVLEVVSPRFELTEEDAPDLILANCKNIFVGTP